ncbi:MAG TPA: ABC transporter ATP-binding protein [Candidatus Saccharimonadaceae bacterium]|nr:ABC transporter ATP-binding protein [Candidatus Saccharimonadaceae bacterium]
MITVKNITKTYGRKQNAFVAIDNLSFQIPSRTTVAILGKSGSGKSTLMHAMSGLDRPEKGKVVIDGKDILTLKARDVDAFRANKMSFIFQSFFIQANESCFDNVSLPLEIAKVPRSKRRAKVEAALAAVELSDKKKSRARDLSGGQKQRLAIARAIVNEPEIIFADEPTGNLDSVTGGVVEDFLFQYAQDKGATLIIVTHDPDLAGKCDARIEIQDGIISKMTGLPTKGKK